MRDPWIDYFVAAGLVTVLWTQASIVPTGLVARMLVTILASDHGLAVWETGDRPFRDGLNHFVLRLVPFLVGHVTGQRPLYGFAVRETGDSLIQTG